MIHEKAHVTPDCVIGRGSMVWQFASVTGGTVLGKDCSVSPFAMLHGPVFGEHCRISGGVMMGPGFKVGDGVFIGPNVTLCNDAWPRAYKDGYEPQMFNGSRWAVIVESGASIGAGAVILPGVRIGADAMISAGSVVTGDVPAGYLWCNGTSRAVHKERDRMRFAKQSEVAIHIGPVGCVNTRNRP